MRWLLLKQDDAMHGEPLSFPLSSYPSLFWTEHICYRRPIYVCMMILYDTLTSSRAWACENFQARVSSLLTRHTLPYAASELLVIPIRI